MSTLAFTIIDSPDTSLHKSAVLVTGGDEALLVDAGFTRSDGRWVVEQIKNSGKQLTTVIISHGDPDCYFGSEIVQDAFPEARFLAAPSAVERITETFRAKLLAWSRLGPELPSRLVVPEPLPGDSFEFAGHRFELRGADFHLPDRHYLWEHRNRVILGGVLLFDGLHVWTADTPTTAQRGAWIELLDEMEALDPALVVAGHRSPDAGADTKAIGYTRTYLQDFERELGKAADAATAEAALKGLYPNAGLPMAVEIGTKVAKGELQWD